MKAIIARLLVFFLGIPAILALCIFLPQHNNLAISIVIMLFSGVAGIEVAAFMPEGRTKTSAAIAFGTALIAPLLTYLSRISIIPADATLQGMTLAVIILGGRQILSKQSEIPGILRRLLSRLLPLLYPGLLASFLVRIATIGDTGKASVPFLLLFLAMAFGNDSMAWLFGVLLGRRRNIVAVSPNKSVAGFIGGIGFSLAAGFLAPALFPAYFKGPAWAWGLLGLVTGLGVVMGDLAESALKRSAGVKDSGSIIPGRGGVLDSIDSLIYAAPLFWAWIRYFPGIDA